jgi:hypothetical protein
LLMKVNPLQNNYMLTFLLLKDYSDERTVSLFTRDSRTWMALLMNFSKVILLGQNLMGNCTVFRPKNKTQRFYLSKTTNVVRSCPQKLANRTCLQKFCIWNIDTGAAFKGPLHTWWIQKKFWQSEPLVTLYFDEKEEIKI